MRLKAGARSGIGAGGLAISLYPLVPKFTWERPLILAKLHFVLTALETREPTNVRRQPDRSAPVNTQLTFPPSRQT